MPHEPFNEMIWAAAGLGGNKFIVQTVTGGFWVGKLDHDHICFMPMDAYKHDHEMDDE